MGKRRRKPGRPRGSPGKSKGSQPPASGPTRPTPPRGREKPTAAITLARSDTWPPAFLAALLETGVIRYACEVAQIDRSTAYARRETDPDFARAWQSTLDDALDAIELGARRRAIRGVRRIRFQPKTGAIHYEREYPEPLVMFLLKAHRRDVYGDKVETTFKKDPGPLVSYPYPPPPMEGPDDDDDDDGSGVGAGGKPGGDPARGAKA